MNGLRLISVLSLLLLLGCDQATDSSDLADNQKSEAGKKVLSSVEIADEQVELQNELLNELREAENRPPEFLIDLPSAEGWKMSKPQVIPFKGIKVQYEYESLSMIVRLSQYSSGHSLKTDDVNSDALKEHFERSKVVVLEDLEDGKIDSVTLDDEGVVALGESSTKTLWAKYIFKIGKWRCLIETFIWSHKNHLFVLDVESSPRRSKAKKAAVKELLTAIGNAK